MNVKILQGPSGAGKTTYTKNLPGAVFVCSADDFFMKNGEYQFNPTQLSQAHAWCLERFIEAIRSSNWTDTTIVVDNTNTTALEIAPYYQAALAFGHDVEIVTLDVTSEVAHARNVHRVPLNTVRSQVNRIRESVKYFPRWWKRTVITSGSGNL